MHFPSPDVPPWVGHDLVSGTRLPHHIEQGGWQWPDGPAMQRASAVRIAQLAGDTRKLLRPQPPRWPGPWEGQMRRHLSSGVPGGCADVHTVSDKASGVPPELPGPFIPQLPGGDKNASQSRVAQAISELIVNPGRRSCPQHKLRGWKFFHSGSQGVESEKNITIKKRKKKK